MYRLLVRPVVVLTMIGAAVLVTPAAPALAHVTVHSTDDHVAGGFATIAFRVPNESETASTAKLQVRLPAEHPFPEVSVRPPAGWTVTVTKAQAPSAVTGVGIGDHGHDGSSGEAVSEITWTAGDPRAAIGPGEFEDFVLRVGPLPATGVLVFPAVQTYDDGRVDRWIEPETGDGVPGHPAPVLNLAGGPAAAPAAGTTAWELLTLWLAAMSLLVAVGSIALSVWLARRRRA